MSISRAKGLIGKYLEGFTAFYLHHSIFLYFISHRIKFVFHFVHEIYRLVTSIYLSFQLEFVLCKCKTLRKIRLMRYCDLWKICRISFVGRLYGADKGHFYNDRNQWELFLQEVWSEVGVSKKIIFEVLTIVSVIPGT
jgi:hypothetical protein